MQLNKSSEIHNHEVILQFESKFEDTESLEIKSWVRIPDWTPVTGVQILDSPKYRSTLLSSIRSEQFHNVKFTHSKLVGRLRAIRSGQQVAALFGLWKTVMTYKTSF